MSTSGCLDRAHAQLSIARRPVRLKILLYARRRGLPRNKLKIEREREREREISRWRIFGRSEAESPVKLLRFDGSAPLTIDPRVEF